MQTRLHGLLLSEGTECLQRLLPQHPNFQESTLGRNALTVAPIHENCLPIASPDEGFGGVHAESYYMFLSLPALTTGPRCHLRPAHHLWHTAVYGILPFCGVVGGMQGCSGTPLIGFSGLAPFWTALGVAAAQPSVDCAIVPAIAHTWAKVSTTLGEDGVRGGALAEQLMTRWSRIELLPHFSAVNRGPSFKL